jgi:hypothetical protein
MVMGYQKYGGDINLQAEDQDVSKINAGGLINLRVQDSWNVCHRYYKDGDYEGLRDELTALWTEFYADATLDQKKKLIKIDKRISKCLWERNRSMTDKKRWMHFNIRYKHAVYTKWLFLKTLEKSQGIGRAYRDPGQDDWE